MDLPSWCHQVCMQSCLICMTTREHVQCISPIYKCKQSHAECRSAIKCLANDSCVTCARVHCAFAGTLLKGRLWRTSHSWLHWYRAAGSAPMLWILFLIASNCACKAEDVTCVTICTWNCKSATHTMSVACVMKNKQGHDLGMSDLSWAANTRVSHMMQCALHATVRNIHAVTVLGSSKNKILLSALSL